MTRKKVTFLINPISGGKKKKGLEKLIRKYLDQHRFEADFKETEYVNHASELTRQAIEERVSLIVAVGGDGTINEVAKELLHSNIPMGIVPLGSGNGLARYLGIPAEVGQAVQRINALNLSIIDSGMVNGHAFFNMAGMGFDALISDRFAENTTRGAIGYTKIVLEEIRHYKAQGYTLQIDGKELERKAFMISIANSPQYGNNAYVAPEASARDGLLDVCIIKPFPLYQLPIMVYHLFSRTAHQSEYVEIIKGKDIRIERKQAGPVHLDGEPYALEKILAIQVLPSSLKVIS